MIHLYKFQALTPKHNIFLYHPSSLRIPQTTDCHHQALHRRDPAQLRSAMEVSSCFPSELDLSYTSWHGFTVLRLITVLTESTKYITIQLLLHSVVVL